MRGELAKGAAPHLLVQLGELARHCRLAVAEHGRHGGEAGGKPLRRLEVDQAGVEPVQRLQRFTTGTALGRQEAAEEEAVARQRSEEHTSELQSLMRISYAVFCLKKKKQKYNRK